MTDSTLPTTPLRTLIEQGPESARVTPLGSLDAARRMFIADARLDMQRLATDIGVSRVTLYRWVGNHDALLAEVLWSLAQAAWTEAATARRSRGAAGVAEHAYHFIRVVRDFEPFQRFIVRDTDYALKMLTSRYSPVQGRTVEAVRQLLEEEIAAGAIELPHAVADIAYVIIRICESFLYNQVITGGDPNLRRAGETIHALLLAPWQRVVGPEAETDY